MRRSRLLFLALLTGCDGPPLSLLETAEDLETIEVSEIARESLIPPFPGTRRFEVDVPAAGFLRFAPALVTSGAVRRARVSFRIDIEANGDTATVYEETFRFPEANQWHDREVDLSSWAGQRVSLVLVTRTPEDRTNILWADRVRTVWGEPRVVSSFERQLVMLAGDVLGDTEEWLTERADPAGVVAEDVRRTALSLSLAALLGLAIRSLYLRHALLGLPRDAYGNLFPLFSLGTVLVIVVVQSSLALSLGLLGALSIVRFRTAIKTPEEIAYLLFCISVGVALGAQQPALAVLSVALVSLFVGLRGGRGSRQVRFLLTLSGDDAISAIGKVRPMVRELEIERLDETPGGVELKAVVLVDDGAGATRLVSTLRETLPAFQFSFVAADDVL